MSLELIITIIICIGLGFIIGGFISNKQKRRHDNAAKNWRTPEEVLPEIQQRLQAGENKIKLMKYVREETGIGLEEAKDLVENQKLPPNKANLMETDLFPTVQEMLQSGDDKIKVIKYVRGETGLGLKEAKEFVEEAEQQQSN